MLILIRGLPGSGKSTLAQALRKSYPEAKHFEADMYFTTAEGEYNFDPAKLKQAHAWCQGLAETALSMGYTTIVSNTFTRLWEMQPYLRAAKQHGVRVQVIECHGNFSNIHGVPIETINSMRSRWEHYSQS